MALPFIGYHLLFSMLTFGIGVPITFYGAQCLLTPKTKPRSGNAIGVL
jgi:hypothetical protein